MDKVQKHNSFSTETMWDIRSLISKSPHFGTEAQLG